MCRWFLGVVIVAFVIYAKPIVENVVDFHPDEMYWIGTGRIVPLLVARDTEHPFWDEYYGYANFNGAKLLYGIGLTIMGQADYRFIGLPPSTYYRFEPYEGKPFPSDHLLSPILRDGRLISALFAALTVGLMFIWSREALGSFLGATVAAVVFVLHPIMITVATHAYADSLFVFFIIAIFLIIHHYLGDTSTRSSRWWTVSMGAILAFLVSVKLNGLLFIFPIILAFFMKELTRRVSWKKHLQQLLIVMTVLVASFSIVFAILHPNFFFFPKRGPVQIIADRVHITRDHMVYFDTKQPSHVLWDIPSRARSIYRQIFIWPWMALLLVVGGLLFIRKIQFFGEAKHGLITHTAVSVVAILIGTLEYVVFDEARYYLPLLPFVSLLAGGSIMVLYGKVLTFIRYDWA